MTGGWGRWWWVLLIPGGAAAAALGWLALSSLLFQELMRGFGYSVPYSTRLWLDALPYHSGNWRVTLGLASSAAVATPVSLLPGAALLARLLSPKRGDDNARWASWRHMRRAGFSPRTGLYLGQLAGRYLRLGTPRQRKHVAIVAPSQSGKGVGFVVPAGLCDPGEAVSLVFVDPKFQAFQRTAGWQKAIGARVVLFAPLSETGQTARYNPCAYVRRAADGSPTVDTWGDLEDIVRFQIATDEKNPFWTDSSRIAYTAVLCFLAETPGADFTIPGAIDLMNRADAPAYITHALRERAGAGKPYSAVCADNLREFLSGAEDGEKLRDGIRKTIKSKLGVFLNPRVRAALSANDFDLRRVLKDRTALYLGMAFPDLEKLQPLLTLLLQQMVDLNTRGTPGLDPEVKYECVVVYDEFTNIGRMEKAKAHFSYAAEYGFRLMPVFQSYAQLAGTYGKDDANAILDNCKIEVVLGGIKNVETCQTISKRLGTVRGVRKSTSGGGMAGFADLFRGRVSRAETVQPLITPYGVEHLPDDTALVMHGGSDGCLVKRIRYFENYRFRTRVLPPPDVPAIEVELLYDKLPSAPSTPSPAPEKPGPKRAANGGAGAKPAGKAGAKPKGGKPAASGPDCELEMSVAQAEATLFAASGGTFDLAAFKQSPAEAKAQIDRVVHGLPTKPMKGRAR